MLQMLWLVWPRFFMTEQIKGAVEPCLYRILSGSWQTCVMWRESVTSVKWCRKIRANGANGGIFAAARQMTRKSECSCLCRLSRVLLSVACCCTFLTVSIAVVDSTEPPGGRQVLCSHGHVNCVAQVKLHSHTQATLHKYKVPKPVNTYTFIKKIILKCKFKAQ